MTIDSLKALEKLMILCKKQGVSSITVDGITFNIDIGHSNKKPKAQATFNTDDIKLPHNLDGDALLFYSSEGNG